MGSHTYSMAKNVLSRTFHWWVPAPYFVVIQDGNTSTIANSCGSQWQNRDYKDKTTHVSQNDSVWGESAGVARIQEQGEFCKLTVLYQYLTDKEEFGIHPHEYSHGGKSHAKNQSNYDIDFKIGGVFKIQMKASGGSHGRSVQACFKQLSWRQVRHGGVMGYNWLEIQDRRKNMVISSIYWGGQF